MSMSEARYYKVYEGTLNAAAESDLTMPTFTTRQVFVSNNGNVTMKLRMQSGGDWISIYPTERVPIDFFASEVSIKNESASDTTYRIVLFG